MEKTQNRVLVIAPHHDDEILGVGGTMARFASEGSEVFVMIVTSGKPPMYDQRSIEKTKRAALAAHAVIGVRETYFLEFPAAGLEQISGVDIEGRIGALESKILPDHIFVPFIGDIHVDHQKTFICSLVANRPNRAYRPRKIFAYETLSETNWNAPYITPAFLPNTYIDVSEYLDKKIRALRAYRSQLKPFPNERSIQSIRALANLRGSTVGVKAAEAFVLIRDIR
jgi:N-acetylglucosamine malate deacetylase 1